MDYLYRFIVDLPYRKSADGKVNKAYSTDCLIFKLCRWKRAGV